MASGYSNNIKNILDEYDALRADARNKRDKKIANVYKSFPRIEEIDRTINNLGMENMNNIFRNPLKKDELNDNFRFNLNKLEDEKKLILKEFNIDEDYNKYIYKCKLCSDTGYIDNKKCSCFKQKIINYLYSQSNMENILNEQNFETYSSKYFSESVIGKMDKIYTTCLEFCDDFDNDKQSLLFYGNTGTGKTFLSSCIAKKLMDNGKIVIYTRAARLFSMYEDYKFGRLNGEDVKDQLDMIYNVDLLIIDDLGTENQNKLSMSYLFDVINTRSSKGKKMIISTNYDMSELTKVYSSRLTSRIYEYFIPLHFYGDDIRAKKMVEKFKI